MRPQRVVAARAALLFAAGAVLFHVGRAAGFEKGTATAEATVAV